MMKIFQSYIARHFLVPFVAALSVFTGLLLLGNVFGHLYVFTKGEVSVLVFIKYILCQAPYFMVKIMPIATLLAVLAALGEIIKSGEWKAGMAGGWRPLDMLMPLVLCAAAAGLLQFAVQETAAPSLYLESEHIFRRDIRGRDDWARLVVNNVSFSAGEGRFVTCRVFDGRVNTMQQVVLSAYSGMKLGYGERSAVFQPLFPRRSPGCGPRLSPMRSGHRNPPEQTKNHGSAPHGNQKTQIPPVCDPNRNRGVPRGARRTAPGPA